MLEDRQNRLDRRYRRALRWGLVLSVAVHALLFLVFRDTSLPDSPFSAAGERTGDPRAAVGGGLQAVELRAPAEEVPTPPEPVPDPEPVVVDVEPPQPTSEEMALPSVELADLLSVPGDVGLVDEPGRADGKAEGGDGGTEAEGRFRVVPPRPRGMILPPANRPAAVRGQEVEVWVFVNAKGSVVADSTRLNPPTGDRRFDRRLREHAAGWRFEAARRDGQPVGEWFRYVIVM